MIDGDINRCSLCEIPSCFLGFLCLYVDVPMRVVRTYCKRNIKLVRQAEEGFMPFLNFSNVIESQHRCAVFGAPASIYRRQHDTKLRRPSVRFASENEVFAYLRDEFHSGIEWISDVQADDYGQPSYCGASGIKEGKSTQKKQRRK